MAILPAACWADGFGFDNESMASALELAMTLALKLEIFDYVSTMCIAEPLIQQGWYILIHLRCPQSPVTNSRYDALFLE